MMSFGFIHGQSFKGLAFHVLFFGKVPPHGEAGKQTRQLSEVFKRCMGIQEMVSPFQGALRHLVFGSDFNQPLNEVLLGIWCPKRKGFRNTTFQTGSSWMKSQ